MTEPLLTLCIPTYQNYQQLQWCIYSLVANTEYPLQIIIVNNDPSPESQDSIASMIKSTDVDNIEVVQPGSNMKWMGSINIGLAKANTPFFCMMNDDVVFPPNSKEFWRTLTRHFNRPEVGAVGPCSNFVSGNQNLFNINLPVELETSLLIGFCMIIRTELLKKIGGLDESLPGGDDLDSSIRIQDEGYVLVADRSAYLHHIGQQTGQRVHQNYWDSKQHQEATNNAIIRKHGVKKWYSCFQMGWQPYASGTGKIDDAIREEEWLSNHLESLEGKKGLNLGCGHKGNEYEAIGIDQARTGEQGAGGRKYEEANPDTTADASDLPIQNNSIDYIMAPHILEHLVDPYKALTEWKRVLRPSGTLLLTMPNHEYLPTMLIDYTHVHAYTPDSAKSLLESQDFWVEEIIDNIHGTIALKCRTLKTEEVAV